MQFATEYSELNDPELKLQGFPTGLVMENLEPTRNGALRCFTWSFRSCRRIWEALQIVECLSGHELSEKFFRWQLDTFGNLQPEVHLCFDESDLCVLLMLHSLSHAFSEFELFGLSF